MTAAPIAEDTSRSLWTPPDEAGRGLLRSWHVKIMDRLLTEDTPIPIDELLELVPSGRGGSRRACLYGWLRWLEKGGAIVQEVRLENSAALSGLVRIAVRKRLDAQMGTQKVAADE